MNIDLNEVLRAVHNPDTGTTAVLFRYNLDHGFLVAVVKDNGEALCVSTGSDISIAQYNYSQVAIKAVELMNNAEDCFTVFCTNMLTKGYERHEILHEVF